MVLLLTTACNTRPVSPTPEDAKPLAPSDTLAQPDANPILRIEPGSHFANILRIDVDAAERYVVTASLDKTARVWDLTTGHLLKMLRPPIGEGKEGELNAVAISPDGEWVAVAGWTAFQWDRSDCIYIFQRSTGALVARIRNLPNIIYDLAFSPDGDKLAVALGLNNGIRLFSSQDWRELARDTQYGDNSYSVDFDAQGRVVTTSSDGLVRLYDPRLNLLHTYQTRAGHQPYSAHFSPDGKKVAVGFEDSSAVELLAADGLQSLYFPDAQGIDNGSIVSVAWLVDGRLVAGGSYQDGKGVPLLVWDQGGQGRRSVWRVTQNTVMDIKPLKDGGVVVGTGDSASLVRLDVQGFPAWESVAGILAFSWTGDRRQFSVDRQANTIRMNFAKENPAGEVQHRQVLWNLATLQFNQSPSQFDLQPPRQRADGLAITDWVENQHPKLNGQALRLQDHEISRSLAINSSGDSFVLGTEWFLRLYDKDGASLWQKPVPVPNAWAVTISGDDRWVVAALGDGTVRWYEKQTGNERLAFYLHPDEQRWIAWTPQGFYAAAPGAESLIGYHLNRGADKEAEFVGVDQLRTVFARADLVSKALNDEYPQLAQTALRQVGEVWQILHAGLPPKIEIAGGLQQSVKGRDFELDFTLLDQGGGIGRVEYRLNSEVVSSAVGRPYAPRSPAGQQRFRRPFSLVNGEHLIEVIAYGANDKLAAKPLTLKVQVDDPVQREPSLYVLSVGVTRYRDQDSFGLKFAAADAVDFADALKAQEGRLFRNVHTKVLADSEATLTNIHSAFQQIAGQAQPQDVFVLYLAGHGLVVDGRYHFVPQDLVYENNDNIREKALSEEKLRDWLALVEVSKRLTVIDSCHAGKALNTLASLDQPLVRGAEDKAAIGRLMDATGSSVLAAASSQQQAFEGIAEPGGKGHGLLTHVLLKGLQGSADILRKDSQIDVEELRAYAQSEVPRLSKQQWKYEQTPMGLLKGQDFPIAQIRQ